VDYGTAFVLGLAGSLHCAGMCGPLTLALPQEGNRRAVFVTGRLAYNAGRIVTYALLGAVFGLWGRLFFLAGLQQTLSIALGLMLIVGLMTSRKLALWRPATWMVGQIKSRISELLRQHTIGSQALLGFFNGFLPCGLVYVACAGATVSGGSLRGAICMAIFGAGTIPMMLAIGLSGRLIPFSVRLKLIKVVPVSVFLLGMLLVLRGLSLGIPYLSPDLSSSGSICCHHEP
jgi:uncharacterized protein